LKATADAESQKKRTGAALEMARGRAGGILGVMLPIMGKRSEKQAIASTNRAGFIWSKAGQ
jgi:hypothetical protein